MTQNMLRQLICFICFLVSLASTGATQRESIRCSSNSTTPKTGEPSDNELIDYYNDLLQELLIVFLEDKGILVRLVFDCNLAKDPVKVKKLDKSFMVVAENKITDDFKFQLTSLTEHFTNLTQKVQDEVEKLQKPSCLKCLKCCWSKPPTFRFGCGYIVREATILTKCAFEKSKK